MAFGIGKTVSSGAWGDVDKGAIWARLKAGLEEGADGAREAVRETYALVKADIRKELTQADCWGPHHELQQDGTLALNRGGVTAAAGALRGARAEPDLTPQQRHEAETHLRRHYRDLDLTWPGEGELVRLSAALTGEMRVDDVPLAAGVNLAALQAGDEDPLEVVVEIPAGKSRRGWTYTPQAIQRVVSEIMSRTASGFLGHQRPEDVDHQFPLPVTHWVGALWRDGKAYVRGVVDSAAGDLKRWIRAGRVRQVSIFGVPTLEQAGGETKVVDYQLLSIDWTPLDRAGMTTAVVAMGEMDAIEGAMRPESNGGGKGVNLKELIAKLKELGISARQLIGEMGWTFDALAAEVGGDAYAALKAEAALAPAVGEIAVALGMAKDAKPADVVVAVKAARDGQVRAAAAEREGLVVKVVGEMVAAESPRPLVKRMLRLPDGADEAAIRKAVGELLGSEDVKAAMAAAFKEPVIAPVAPGRDQPQAGLRTRRVPI